MMCIRVRLPWDGKVNRLCSSRNGMESVPKFFKLFIFLTGSSAVIFVFYSMNHGQFDYSRSDQFNSETALPEQIQKERRLRIDKVCNILELERNQSLKKQQLDHIIVDDKHKLLYCYVPKVACTNWKRVLLFLSDKLSLGLSDPLSIPANNSHRANAFRTLDTYSKAQIQHRIKKYLKFLFVRHPFDRLVSAYRNKFTQNYNFYFHTRYGKSIVQKFRRKASNESLQRGHDVTFQEFVKYLIDPETHRSPLNEHWRPAFDLCHPCHVRYDIVGKFETLDSDASYVLNKIKSDKFVQFPRKNRTSTKIADECLKDLNKLQLFKLYQLYALDFKLFTYTFSEFDGYLPEL